MGKSFKWLFWTVLFLLMLLAIDQFFVQAPPIHPAHDAVSRFYKDFRHRLLAMTLGEKPPVKPPPIKMPAKSDTIETVIDKQVTAEKAKTKGKAHRSAMSIPMSKGICSSQNPWKTYRLNSGRLRNRWDSS